MLINTSSKTCFREYSDDGSFSLIVPNSLDNDFWKDTSRLVLIVHGMNGNSKGGIRGIEYDFPGTKSIYLEYEKVCSLTHFYERFMVSMSLLRIF